MGNNDKSTKRNGKPTATVRIKGTANDRSCQIEEKGLRHKNDNEDGEKPL